MSKLPFLLLYLNFKK